ncbi:MAG: hypothetical protein KY455_08000 [Euryarchaeota archaeon]|nr:hypothetical protein [Euryarchaeota archaeon]
MRPLAVAGVMVALLVLSGCLGASTPSGRLLPYDGWPVPPESCGGSAVHHPLTADDLGPVAREEVFMKPQPHIRYRPLNDAEQANVLDKAAAAVPILTARTPEVVNTSMRPHMDGHHHTGDWTFTIQILYEDGGPDDRHEVYVDKADNRTFTITPSPYTETTTKRDPPDRFVLGYTPKRLTVTPETAAAARDIVETWDDENGKVPKDFTYSDATWTPRATDCVLVHFSHHPVDADGERVAMGYPGDCSTGASYWVDPTRDLFLEEVPLRDSSGYCSSPPDTSHRDGR